MERKILFKAKKLSDGAWVKGDLYHNVRGFECCIGQQEKDDVYIYPVDPSTVCQFTGLKDKDGKEIWEHDYVSGYREGEIIYETGEFSLKTDVITVQLSMFLKDVLGNIRSKTQTGLLVLGSKFDRKEGEK